MEFETRIVKYNGKSYPVELPKLVRKIEFTSRSNRGLMPSLKEPGKILHYESLMEHDSYLLHDHDPHAEIVISQPRLGITYKTINGEIEEITVDTYVLYTNVLVVLYEVKTEEQLKELLSPVNHHKLTNGKLKEREKERKKANWQLKQKSIINFCRKKGYKYMIMTEKRIRNQRLDNLKDLLKDAKHWSPEKIQMFNPGFQYPNNLLTTINNILQNDPNLTIKELSDLLAIHYGNFYNKSVILSLLKNLIYYGQILIDWDIPFDESHLKVSQNRESFKQTLLPVYEIEEQNYEIEGRTESVKIGNRIDESIITLLLQELDNLGWYKQSEFTKMEIENYLLIKRD